MAIRITSPKPIASRLMTKWPMIRTSQIEPPPTMMPAEAHRQAMQVRMGSDPMRNRRVGMNWRSRAEEGGERVEDVDVLEPDRDDVHTAQEPAAQDAHRHRGEGGAVGDDSQVEIDERGHDERLDQHHVVNAPPQHDHQRRIEVR